MSLHKCKKCHEKAEKDPGHHWWDMTPKNKALSRVSSGFIDQWSCQSPFFSRKNGTLLWGERTARSWGRKAHVFFGGWMADAEILHWISLVNLAPFHTFLNLSIITKQLSKLRVILQVHVNPYQWLSGLRMIKAAASVVPSLSEGHCAYSTPWRLVRCPSFLKFIQVARPNLISSNGDSSK